MGKERTLSGPCAVRFKPPTWFANCQTPDGSARFWRLIPAEAFLAVRLFRQAGVNLETLGDVPIANEKQRAEICRFLGRQIVHVDRVVLVYQAKRGAQRIATWLDEDILRLAKEAAVFNGLRQ